MTYWQELYWWQEIYIVTDSGKDVKYNFNQINYKDKNNI